MAKYLVILVEDGGGEMRKVKGVLDAALPYDGFNCIVVDNCAEANRTVATYGDQISVIAIRDIDTQRLFESIVKVRKALCSHIFAWGCACSEGDIAKIYFLGADSYFPFDDSAYIMAERIKALYRRRIIYDETASLPGVRVEDVLEIQDLRIDTKGLVVSRRGRRIPLTPKEFDILLFLARNKDTVMSEHAIFTNVWEYHVVFESDLSSRIAKLRRKLGDNPKKPRYIVNSRGKGYMLSSMPCVYVKT